VTSTMSKIDLQVWVGCLAHYNNGDLIGEWVSAEEAPDWVCPKRNPANIYINCEETWIFDHEIPWVRGEMDPMTARKWAEAVDWVEEHQVEAVRDWASWLGLDDPEEFTQSRFEDAYQGQYEKAEDHAYQLVEEAYDLVDVPFFSLHFDEVAWQQDYYISDSGHVFNAHAS
jgi:antirestriction protein